ncbi:uncharacterized protein TNCV_88401 [Trichonephila clavipes]|nr:uncharacterized protein TNCV_88401 [Trichonephila clavipes]
MIQFFTNLLLLCDIDVFNDFMRQVQLFDSQLTWITTSVEAVDLGRCVVLQLRGCGSPVVKVSDHERHFMSSSPVPLKTRRVEQRFTLNLSRAEMFSRWCGVVVRRGGVSSGVVHVT